MRGIGEQLEFFDAPCEFYAVIAQGEGGVLSKDAYREFDALYPEKKCCPSDNGALAAAIKIGDKATAYRHMGNALYRPGVSLNPGIARTLAALGGAGALKTVMTGSGSACAGFFESPCAAATAAERLKEAGFYARAVKTLKNGMEIMPIR